jgi:hypothetical protein
MLTVIRFLIPQVAVPLGIKLPLDFLLTIMFLGLPIYAIYRAMSGDLRPKHALLFITTGVLIQGAAIFLDLAVFRQKGIGSAICEPIKPLGLQIWCVGLGALLASLLREKNILLPIAIFLIFFDIFLVLTPLGPTQKIMSTAPQILKQIGMSIPSASTQVQLSGKSEILANVGPADLVFLGMFFLAMFRFEMKPKKTLIVLIPTLLAYLIFVISTRISLPALVPIGLVTLIINRNEFKLSKDEFQSTILISVLMLGGLIYSATRSREPKLPRQPVEISPKPASLASPAPAKLPAKAGSN